MRKSLNFCKTVEVEVVGVVENMSYVICPHCGERYEIFGKGDTAALASTFDTRFLGEIGIDPEMSKLGDQGAIETYDGAGFTIVSDVVDEIIKATPEPGFAGQK